MADKIDPEMVEDDEKNVPEVDALLEEVLDNVEHGETEAMIDPDEVGVVF